EGQLETPVGLHVALRNMVHHLCDGPSTGTIRSSKLPGRETADRGSKGSRRHRNLFDETGVIGGACLRVRVELSDRKPKLVQLGIGHPCNFSCDWKPCCFLLG